MTSQDSNSKNLDLTRHKNYQEALEVLEDEDVILVKKLECLHVLGFRHVPSIPQDNLESEILSRLMPQSNEILLCLFERAIELTMHSEQICRATLNTLKEYLQMVINLLQTLEGLLDFVICKSKINLSAIQSLPLNVSKMLYSTFLHCKESQNFYGVYFDSLDEILTLFKQAQEVHVKLLRVLNVHIVFNFFVEDELLLFKQILEAVFDIGRLVSEMNVKSMVHNCKAYVALTNKHMDVLSADFSIRPALAYFSKEIMKNLRTLTQQGAVDENTVLQTVKIVNFFIKVMVKLCNTFWQSLKTYFDEVWDFLISFYSFHRNQLLFQGFPKSSVDMIKSQLFYCCDRFLDKLINNADFTRVSHFSNRVHNSDDVFGFLVLFNFLLRKLLHQKGDAMNSWSKMHFPSFLELAFVAAKKCYAQIITDYSIYEDLITTVSAFVLLNNNNYVNVDLILCKNLFDGDIWMSLIAADVWILVLSHCSSSVQFETLCDIVNHCDYVMKLRFMHSPNLVVFGNFVGRLHQMQTSDVKFQFLDKFPPLSHMHVWKHIGFEHVPETILLALIEKMERFDADKCTCEEFIFMCDAMKATATVNFEEVFLDANKLSFLIMKLWDFDAGANLLTNDSFFKIYTTSLCNLTSSFAWKWTNSQVLQILQQLKLLITNSTSVKLSTLQLLNKLSTKFFENSPEEPTINVSLSELLANLLGDRNSVIRQYALEVLVAFVNGALHDKVVNNSLGDRKDLRAAVSNFLGKKPPVGDVADSNTFLKLLGGRMFEHRCLEWADSLPQMKKPKVQNMEAATVLRRIRNDVNYFCKVCADRNELTRENVSDVNYVLTQLQNYV